MTLKQVANGKESDMKELRRDKWDSKAEFILSCLSYAIGIGNVWRFPYLCYRNGGGAFLVPYLIMLFLCGIPLFFIETSLGQFTSRASISVFRICPLFKGAGYTMIVVSFIVSIYFNTICAYPLVYLLECFQWNLPWSNCGNPWNTYECRELAGELPYLNALNQNNSNISIQLKTAADEFFHNNVLQISSGIEEIGGIVWKLFFCNLFSWIVIYLCIIKGVKSMGKVVYFTTTFPFIILFILLIRGLTLPGAWNGIHFYIWPQWDQLTNLKVWADAAMQIFFSLGPGWGGIITMASFNDFRYNHKISSIVIPLVNSATSIFAGFVVFSIIGFMAHKTNLPVATVATSGPGLAFVTYPQAISLLPMPHLWAILFFLMLFFLGLGTLFAQIEGIIYGVVDEYPSLKRHKFFCTLFTVTVLAVASNLFTTKGGMYWLQLFDWYASSISVILVCIVEVIVISWIYGAENFVKDIEFMIQEKISYVWKFCWRIVTPSILMFLFIAAIALNRRITYNNLEYPDWAVTFGWSTCIFSILCIPLHMGYRLLYLYEGDLIERFRLATSPEPEWGPDKFTDKIEWAKAILKDLGENIELETETEHKDQVHEQFVNLCNSKEK